MKKLRWFVAIGLFLAFYLNTVVFARYNLFGIRPDVILAFVVSIGVMRGALPAGIIGVCMGFVIDIFFEKFVGIHALSYMIAGIAGGLFYGKFYADNIVVPAVVAGITSFLKEHILALVVVLAGGRFYYPSMFALYILPCALVTAGVCALIHFFFRFQSIRSLHPAGIRNIRSNR